MKYPPNLPILLLIMFKIIHITSRTFIFFINFLPPTGLIYVNELSAVLHHKFSSQEAFECKHATAFTLNIPDLESCLFEDTVSKFWTISYL